MTESTIPQVLLKKGRAGAAMGRHPWVFAGVIGEVRGDPVDGDIVKVTRAEDGVFVAYGLYNSKSEIRTRLYSWDPDRLPDEAFFRQKIGEAVALRRDVLGLTDEAGARRLVFSEADGISGLVVDEYGPFLVLQVTSAALFKRLDSFVGILRDSRKPQGILLKPSGDLSKKEGMIQEETVLFGSVPEGPVHIVDRGIEFEVNLRGGQKTGSFLDQSENRIAAASYARDRKVLDLYCYTGGFSLHCAKAGAEEVTGVDSSRHAIETAIRQAEKNNSARVRFVENDVFRFLKESPDSYGLVIVDPPRLAAGRESMNNALRMYHRLNSDAIGRLERGGILVTCSCSGRLPTTEFVKMLSSAARRSNRFLQVLELRGAGRDHPFTPFCPESQYLKCVIARVG
jgi:23S rRNA (cytosine1962-C5)-methyltransferase